MVEFYIPIQLMVDFNSFMIDYCISIYFMVGFAFEHKLLDRTVYQQRA